MFKTSNDTNGKTRTIWLLTIKSGRFAGKRSPSQFQTEQTPARLAQRSQLLWAAALKRVVLLAVNTSAAVVSLKLS